jgi:fatty-acyl-CoA synthase
VAEIYETGLDKNAANYVPLSPISLLQRTQMVFPDRLAVVHGEVRRTWGQTAARARQLSSALSAAGIAKGDTVAALLPNVPAMLEAHFGVLNTGAILNTINTRLDAAAIGFILGHGEAKVLLHDRSFSDTVKDALAALPADARPKLVTVDDP